jgi:hypothetical protein
MQNFSRVIEKGNNKFRIPKDLTLFYEIHFPGESPEFMLNPFTFSKLTIFLK